MSVVYGEKIMLHTFHTSVEQYRSTILVLDSLQYMGRVKRQRDGSAHRGSAQLLVLSWMASVRKKHVPSRHGRVVDRRFDIQSSYSAFGLLNGFHQQMFVDTEEKNSLLGIGSSAIGCKPSECDRHVTLSTLPGPAYTGWNS